MKMVQNVLLAGIIVVSGILFFVTFLEGDAVTAAALLGSYIVAAWLAAMIFLVPRVQEARKRVAEMRRAEETYNLFSAGLPLR